MCSDDTRFKRDRFGDQIFQKSVKNAIESHGAMEGFLWEGYVIRSH